MARFEHFGALVESPECGGKPVQNETSASSRNMEPVEDLG